MKKTFKYIIEYTFNQIYPILKPEPIQRFLRRIGFRFPYYRFAEKLNYRGVVDFVVDGKKMYLKSVNSPLEISIFWYGLYGKWEPKQLRLWTDNVKTADVILDIGANTGLYSIMSLINPKAKIYAFEPVPRNIDTLRDNLVLNKTEQIQIEPIALSNMIGNGRFFIPGNEWVYTASLKKEFSSQFHTDKLLEEIPVELDTVDNFLKSRNISVNSKILCKIDVEGAEDLVVQGMINSLEKYDFRCTLEIFDQDMFSTLRSLFPEKYKFYSIDERSGEVLTVYSFTDGVTNYFVAQHYDFKNI
jgi:FkbM family methyltransferase